MFAGSGSYTNFNFGGTFSGDGGLIGRIKTFNEDVSATTFSATPTFDLSVANNFTITLTANITAITISNWAASKGTTATIRFLQDGTGGRTIAFPAGWKWAGGSAPSVTTTLNKAAIVGLYSPDGGTTIYAFLITDNA
jgi:hypothetical protein